MATPTKLVNPKICRCCCKQLRSNDHPISLFGEKSRREAIVEAYNEITGLEGYENDGLSQFVCRSCARKIATFQEFKTLYRESDSKQRAIHSEPGNKRIKRGKKLEETPPGPTVSPSVWDELGQRTIVRLIIRLRINTGKQTDHPFRRTIWIIRVHRRITGDNSSERIIHLSRFLRNHR